MKLLKKLTAIMLAITMVCGMAVTTYAAEKSVDATVTMNVSKTEVKAGETVDVTLTLDKDIENLIALQYDVFFNSTLFELTGSTIGNTHSAMKISDLDEAESSYTISFVDTQTVGETMSAGTLYTLTFTAKEVAAETTATFSMSEEGLMDINFDDIVPQIAGTSATVTVSPASDDAEEGATIPEGAPFTAVTTDAGEVASIKDKGTIDFTGYSTYSAVPYYHVVIPATATSIDVTYPASENPFVSDEYSSAYGYYADVESWSGDGVTFTEYTYDETAEAYTVTFPLSAEVYDYMTGENNTYSFVLDEDGKGYAVCVERTSYDPIAFFTFEYGEESEDTCEHDYGEGVVTLPTISSKGYTTYTCSQCTDSYTDNEVEKATFTPAYAGPMNGHAVVGGTQQTIIRLFSDKEAAYNSVEYKLEFDPSVINIANAAGQGLTPTIDNVSGSVILAGSELNSSCTSSGKNLGAVILRTVALGDATVTLTSAKIDGVEILTAPISLINTCGYKVTLPEGEGYTVSGDAYVAVKGDYSFTVTVDEDYDSTNMVVKANGTEVTPVDGTYTVSAVASDLAIAVEGVEKKAVTPTYTGYAVSASADVTINSGETAQVKVQVSNSDAAVTTYNAYDLTLIYDTDKLTYVSGAAADTDASVSENNGTIRIKSYGADKDFDTVAVVLNFTAKTTGDANVTISAAKVDVSENAILQNTPAATILDSTTVISVNGYDVTFGEGLSGETVAKPGTDYTFKETEQYYDYDITVKVNGTDITSKVTDNKDGTYTIPGAEVTGDIEVSAEMTPKTFAVSVEGSGSSDVAAQTGTGKAAYNTPYTFKVTKKAGYDYVVTVKIGGTAYTGYQVADGTYTIPGADVTGDIVIAVTKTATEVEVTVDGTGAGSVTKDENPARYEQDYTFTVNKEDGYTYEITVKVDGKDITEYVKDNGDDTYTIPGEYVTGEIEITVTKTADFAVDVCEYITLDGQSMYLVTVSGTLGEGKVAKYDGKSMFWSEEYEAYAYLIITDTDLDTVETEAEEKTAIAEGEAAGTVDYTGDVNGTDLIDVNDAQLTYDMYNAKYDSFESVEMLKFLNADVNADKTVNVNDAAAVIAAIQ